MADENKPAPAATNTSNPIVSAIADTFREHPFGMTVGALLLLTVVFSGVSDILHPTTLAKNLNCEVTKEDSVSVSGLGVHLSFGFQKQTQVTVPQQDLQTLGKNPVTFTCTAK